MRFLAILSIKKCNCKVEQKQGNTDLRYPCTGYLAYLFKNEAKKPHSDGSG